jgi:hypothetical protein
MFIAISIATKKPWQVLVRGNNPVLVVEGGTFVADSLGTLIMPEWESNGLETWLRD